MNTPDRKAPYDAVVIGGGPAGATTAALLAQRGHRVLLLEREVFPRFHVGESLITGMMGIIEELGLTQRLDAMGFQRKHGISLVWGDDPQLWGASFADTGLYEYSYHVERARFDALLLTRARELGVQVVEKATVKEALLEEGRVVGVRYALAGDSSGTYEARAAVTVDASGQARVLARRLTEVDWQDDLRNTAIGTYFSPYTPLPDGQGTHILVEATEGGWFWGIPISDTVLSVGYVTPAAGLSGSGRTPQEVFEERLAGTQIVKDMIAGCERTEGFRVTRDCSLASQDFHGEGWVAVGDSAVFIDPLFSSGVWLGMSGAWLAARSIDAGLRRPEAAAHAMAEYERVYRQLATDILAYVQYFYDPTRAREDYLERAQSAARVVSEQSKTGFVALISGVHALPELAAFDPAADVPLPAAT